MLTKGTRPAQILFPVISNLFYRFESCVIFVRFVVKSVICNPIKPIYGEYKPQSSQRAQSPHKRFSGYQELH